LRVGWTLVVTGVAVALVACSAPNGAAWDQLLRTGVLRVGMDASFPPFEAVSADGSLVGFDVDLVREVSRRLAVEPQFVANLPYDGLYDALTAQRVDVVVSALVINPARREDYAYSTSYFEAGEVLVVPGGEDGIQAMGDVQGQRLAVVLGTEGDREARRWARRLVDLSVVQHETPGEALEAVVTGEVDVALVDHVSALQAVSAGSGLSIVGEPVVSVPYAAAVRREDRRLLRAINQALGAMEEDGTMERLVAKWMGGE
jgi:ABC-type amino acid transport substrate-binding protein